MSLVWYCPNNTSYGQVNRQANETASHHHHHPTDVRYNLHLTSLNTCSFTAQLVELHDKTLLPRRGGLTDAYPSGPSGDQEGGLNINKNTNKQTSTYLYMYIIIHTYIHYITYIHIYIYNIYTYPYHETRIFRSLEIPFISHVSWVMVKGAASCWVFSPGLCERNSIARQILLGWGLRAIAVVSPTPQRVRPQFGPFRPISMSLLKCNLQIQFCRPVNSQTNGHNAEKTHNLWGLSIFDGFSNFPSKEPGCPARPPGRI
jgi:hypothetical protein